MSVFTHHPAPVFTSALQSSASLVTYEEASPIPHLDYPFGINWEETLPAISTLSFNVFPVMPMILREACWDSAQYLLSLVSY